MKRLVLITFIFICAGILNAREKRGYLGVHVQNIPEHYRIALNIEYGVIVTEVEEDSPADKAGIKEGDIILSIKDEKIEDVDDLIYYVKRHPNEEVDIGILRKGNKISLKVKIGEKERGPFIIEEFEPYRYEIEKRIILPYKENVEEIIKKLEEKIKELEERVKKLEGKKKEIKS
ncbi:MAG: PDZ domain-containing protein [candidate division WOR-3 bacterium]